MANESGPSAQDMGLDLSTATTPAAETNIFTPVLTRLENQIAETPPPSHTPIQSIVDEPVGSVDPAQAKKELLEPRIISKAHDAQGRDEKARHIWQVRRDREKHSRDISTNQEQLDALKAKLWSRYDSLGGVVRTKLGLKDATAEAISEQIVQLDAAIRQSQKYKAELPTGRELLTAYYEQTATTPLTHEEKVRFLKPEVVSSLTTDEYTALWRRLNPHFLTHITRQGFRDHKMSEYHSAGLDEFHMGFTSIIEDGKALRPPLALEGLLTRDEASVTALMTDWELQAASKDKALIKWNDRLNHTLGSAPKYPDKTAIHFATQLVANQLYGGETGNEVFFVLPSDIIASQYDFAFNGKHKDLTQPQNELTWNDVFVWPHDLDSPGISVDSGMAFLPKSVRVDPETGSKYESNVELVDGVEKRTPVVDSDLVSRFKQWTQGSGRDFLKGVFGNDERVRDYYQQDTQRASSVRMISDKLIELGFVQDTSTALSEEMYNDLRSRDEYNGDILDKLLSKTRAHWKRVQTGVSAEQYWEAYFTQHPDARPAHISYYDGDPTGAIYRFQQKNNIGKADTSESDGKLLGFEEHFVDNLRSDPRALRGYEELDAMGKKIIEEHFAE